MAEALRYRVVPAWGGESALRHSHAPGLQALHRSQHYSLSSILGLGALGGETLEGVGPAEELSVGGLPGEQILLGLSGRYKGVEQGDGLGRASEPKAESWNPQDMCGWPPSSDAVSLPFRITVNGYRAAVPLSNQIKVNSLVNARVWVAFICYLIRISGSGLPRA